jgi:hypothetical protein
MKTPPMLPKKGKPLTELERELIRLLARAAAREFLEEPTLIDERHDQFFAGGTRGLRGASCMTTRRRGSR